MNIKRRLIISNTLIVIIPFIVTLVVAITFLFVSSKFLNKEIGYNNIKKIAEVKTELFSAANSISEQNLGAVSEVELKNIISKRLSGFRGEYIISANNNIISSISDISKIDTEKAFEKSEDQHIEKIVEINSTSYMFETAHLVLKDSSESKIMLLAPIGHNENLFQEFIMVIICTYIISFIAVNIIMTYGLSKRILNPIASLKKAASEISSGNLNCEVTEEGDEEVKELCHDFEVMRIQLKDSVSMKLKYDDNRKMLISSISHDLKTPITSIKGYVEGILDGVASTPEKTEKYLKTIYSKAEQVDIMIDDLLLYSKLDLNQIPFNFEKTDIVEYFNYCVSEVEPELEKDNIKINLKNNLMYSNFVSIDRDRMRRVIVNIIDNSRKYMGKQQGEISLELRETNSSIIIEVRDNGMGIKSEDVNKIFDKFYRADAARSGAKGSGLGLAIAKQIVEGHNGRIWAVSHDNEGTSIIISLKKVEEVRGDYEENIDS
ncbi:ATPase/histidine kinase/DNA gyrase B/HSP90 domain protein [Clostridiales bacterium oral taxon 876 str. F0540]|nr:ATPase/histidine kinase/DNA gyrase B/HSP90 domain protein [Clostridiales bacterium oral taxon 876 str. F0540]